MLLIGDIHIHPRHTDSIIQMLRDFVHSNDHESHIIFVGDYVYHFSYHRPSLLALLDFFIELTQQGKKVYVLAGNHDWLGQHFVYAESEKVAKWQSGESSKDSPNHQIAKSPTLTFITTPQIIHIESEDVLFLPYMLSWKDSEELNNYISETVGQWNSKQSQKSGELLTPNSKLLTIIHHYYVAETVFPGLKTKFTYKDLALSPRWLDYERVRLISGHIHHPFCYKNYLCVGAVRSTSPQETNQLQYLFSYNLTTHTAIAYQVTHNTILQVEHIGHINQTVLSKQRHSLQEQHTQSLSQGSITITTVPAPLSLDKISLNIISNDLQYDDLSNHIDQSIQDMTRDIKLKRAFEKTDLILNQLVDNTQNFSSGRSDRKTLLDDYLTQKFGEQREVYEKMMKEVGI